MYLICHVTSHDHLVERSCEFTGGSPLSYVTRQISLVTISIVMVGIMCLTCHVPLVNTWLKGYVNLWIEARHGESPSCHVWWSSVWCKWRYKVFNMPRDLTHNVTEGSSNFMSGNYSWYVTILPSLVIIGSVVVEI